VVRPMIPSLECHHEHCIGSDELTQCSCKCHARLCHNLNITKRL